MKQFKALFSTSSIHSLARMGDTSDSHSAVVFLSVEVIRVLEMGGVETKAGSGFSSFLAFKGLTSFHLFSPQYR